MRGFRGSPAQRTVRGLGVMTARRSEVTLAADTASFSRPPGHCEFGTVHWLDASIRRETLVDKRPARTYPGLSLGLTLRRHGDPMDPHARGSPCNQAAVISAGGCAYTNVRLERPDEALARAGVSKVHHPGAAYGSL